jgi:hypothetical protein
MIAFYLISQPLLPLPLTFHLLHSLYLPPQLAHPSRLHPLSTILLVISYLLLNSPKHGFFPRDTFSFNVISLLLYLVPLVLGLSRSSSHSLPVHIAYTYTASNASFLLFLGITFSTFLRRCSSRSYRFLGSSSLDFSVFVSSIHPFLCEQFSSRGRAGMNITKRDRAGNGRRN